MKNPFKTLKTGFSLVKYGMQPKQNLITILIFMAIGLLSEIFTKGKSIIGGFYFLLIGMFIHQMLASLDISTMIQTSKMKKAMQTTIPIFTSAATYLILYTLLVIERIVLIHFNPDMKDVLNETLLTIVMTLFLAMLYTATVYKHFVISTIFFFIVIFAFSFTTAFTSAQGKDGIFSIIKPSFGMTVAIGYILIICGAFIELGLANLFYKHDLSKFAFRGLTNKIN